MQHTCNFIIALLKCNCVANKSLSINFFKKGKRMLNIQEFFNDESGQSMVEYGVTLGAIAAVSYIAVVQLGDKTADLYAWMANHLPGGEADEAGVDQLVRRSEGLSHGLVALSQSENGAVFDVSHNVGEAEGHLGHSLGTTSTAEAFEHND